MIGLDRLARFASALTLVALTWSCASHKAAPLPSAPAPRRVIPDLPARPNLTGAPDDVMSVLQRGPTSLPGESAEIGVGPAPEGFPKEVLPPGAEVGAAAISPRMTTVVALVPGLSLEGRLREQARLAVAGWISAVPTPRGFASGPADRPITVCRGIEFVSIAYLDRAAGGAFVRASLTNDPRRPCIARPDATFADLDLPVLVAPPGAKTTGGGAGGGADAMFSQTRLDTTLTPREVAAHYVRQLESAGWKVEGRANEDDMISVTRLSITSRIGDAMTAVLTIAALPGTSSLDLTLKFVRNNLSRGRVGGRG
jgi:hypothetical protein